MFLCLSNFAWVGENWAEMVKQRGKTFRTPKLKSRKSSLKPPWYDRGVILSVTGKSVNFDNVLAVVQLICRPRGPKSAEQQSENSQTFASDCILSDVPYRGALYKKLRFVNVRNAGTNLGVGTLTWIFMV